MLLKNNLPVILLRGLVLLPYNDLKLEFENDESHNVLDVASLFHDSTLLVVTQKDPYEVNPDVSTLPKIGVVAKITHKMVLPNGKIRVIISGIKRTRVHEYLNLNNNNGVLESIVTDIDKEKIDRLEETAIIRKVYRELELYIRNVPYMGNSVVSSLTTIKDLDKFTDVLAPSLPIPLDRLGEYLEETKQSERARMILMDIYKEEELFNVEKDLDMKVKDKLDSTQKDYVLREKLRMLKEELGDIDSKDSEEDSLKKKLEELDAPDNIKERLKKEINTYTSLSSSSPEVTMIRTYIDWLFDLPWRISTVDNDNIKQARKVMDDTHDGLDKVKDRIIEYLAVKKVTKTLKGPIICLVGPPGVGKTSLAYSIAASLKRNFVKMSVGGMSDESEITGHRRTYLGACPGRIIESMKKAKSNNPVFLIDEIDKMTHDLHGDPVSALLSVLDPEQNKYFSDNYIEEDFDLSNVMFIATANDINAIPDPLKDRLEIINLSGYTELEKLGIAKKHLIPKICSEVGLAHNLKIKDEVLLTIINKYTKEAGVRELERLLSSIARKVVIKVADNTYKASDLNITLKNLESYLGKSKYEEVKVKNQVGVINGLAYTTYGGCVLPIESTCYKGTGKIILTGSLGDVMKESATVALSYIKANYKKFNIDSKSFLDDIHIHALEGATPKEGPSAGIALTSSIISSLSGLKVKSNIAMTGEISLHGDVLPIGGLKEKAMGAFRDNIDTVIFPHDNISDLADIPEEVKAKINFIPVKNYEEVYKILEA